MAETKGFEPSVRVNVHSLSRGAPSTTRPRLHQLAYPLITATYKALPTIKYDTLEGARIDVYFTIKT